MIMLIAREKVEKDLNLILQHYNGKRKIKDKIIQKFVEKGFLYGEINSIFTGTTHLMQIADELFYLFIVLLSKHIDDEELKKRINPDKILTDIEKTVANNIEINRNKDSFYPLVIENVNRDAEGDYSTVFELTKLSEFFDNRIIKYNPETQRPLISKFYSGVEVKEIFINDKNRRAIEQNIVEDKQIPDEITFNVLSTGEEDIEYDPIKRTLTINSGEFDCCDGWHRTVAGRNAYKRKPHSSFYYKVRIVNWDIDKAKAFIHQKSLGSQLDPLAKKSYDVYNPVNQVVTKLNENPKCNLCGKITTNQRDITNKKALIMFNVLFDSISYCFNVETNSDIVKISNYVKEGINLISENNIELLETKQEDQLWVAYIGILAKYYGTEDWKFNIIKDIDQLNLTELLEIPYKTINKVFIKKIIEYINSKTIN